MQNKNINSHSFHENLSNDLQFYLEKEQLKFDLDNCIKIDLHCHDHNSNVPDELLGRILNVPETWLPTEDLIKRLNKNKATAITITNHNNARSCYELIEKGKDILVGAEFSCTVPDFNIGIHVLTYGFNQDQENTLNKLRKNVYQFLQYTKSNNLPTIWAHPLYHYNVNQQPNFDFFSKMVLLFERFEVLNGQRDTWQNMLVKNWIENLTPEQIDADAKRFGVEISLYCHNRYKKSLSAGSDSHMGIFSGQTGTYLHIPNLKKRLKNEKISELALEAIRKGDMAVYGTHQNSEKLTVAFLDYVCQIAIYKQDPGLFRILLHKGSFKEKMTALIITNAFAELKQHKTTMKFIELFHECFTGKVPSKSKRLFLSKNYKGIFDEALKIAKAHNLENEAMIQTIDQSIHSIHDQLLQILFKRLNKHIDKIIQNGQLNELKLIDIIEQLEIPSEIRSFIGSSKKEKSKDKNAQDLAKILDGLPFPFLASSLILAAQFTSTKVLYNNRETLNEFGDAINSYKHPKRMLWLTDTFDDKNGVSHFLQQFHKEVKRLNLPIDFLVCSNTVEPDDHLIVVKPLTEFTLPFYQEQSVRIPNFYEIHQLFLKNEYDRIMCSTEGVMGICSLYLKNAFTVPASFYMHTDWIMFARKVLNFDSSNLNRMRRFMRTFYSGFDNLFVLNSDHQKWLIGKDMEFNPEKVHLTAHWNDAIFFPRKQNKKETFKVKNDEKVLLFSGRLSQEKGIMDLVSVYQTIKDVVPDIKFVFTGTGPLEKDLKKALPEAKFLGWVDKVNLPNIYSSADLLLMPSKFDTFSCVVLEAQSCGLPVIAYKSKGPKDIIIDQKSGYLVSGKNEMAQAIIEHFLNEARIPFMKENAINRSKKYSKEKIVEEFLIATDLKNPIMEDVAEMV